MMQPLRSLTDIMLEANGSVSPKAKSKYKPTAIDKSQPQPGDYVIGLPNNGCGMCGPGRLAYVMGHEQGVSFDGVPKMNVLPLAPDNVQGKRYNVPINAIRIAKPSEIKAAMLPEKSRHVDSAVFRTGQPMLLANDIFVTTHGPMGSGTTLIRAGANVIVDMQGNSAADDDNEVVNLKLGRHSFFDFVPRGIDCYFQDLNSMHKVPCTGLKLRPEVGERLVLPGGYMDRLITMSSRVIKRDIEDAIYGKLGMAGICRKGRGFIALLYGPPGTGKTATVDALARKLGVAVITLSVSSMDSGLSERMAQAFAKAKLYGAILLLDEVDVFIRSRGQHIITDESTSTFLRALEYYDGIMVMTTNLVQDIDHAMFSRIHSCLYYDIDGPESRRAIWGNMITDAMRRAMRCEPAGYELLLDRLASVALNGREIKTAVQNAITRAASGRRELFATELWQQSRWLNPELFIEEATHIHELKEKIGSMRRPGQ